MGPRLSWGRWASLLGAGCLAFAAHSSLFTAPAHACGGFFSARLVEKPSLSHEQVLLIHDPKTAQQHFIRRVVFRKAEKPFGFVVPTPTRPQVNAVEVAPFSRLQQQFGFRPRRAGGLGRLGGQGFGAGAGSIGHGVQVLEKKKVGSFTSFVLAATDQAALAKWLKDNGLVSTKDTDAWLKHYVDLGFFYVALRYDPPKDTPRKVGHTDTLQAETLRISFSTPLPFYPYLEPTHQKPTKARPHRLLELWLATSEPAVPVALQRTGGKSRWVRPLKAGARYDNAQTALRYALAPNLDKLLPKGTLHVQTFQDQKVSREGFGDILFAPRERSAPDAKRKAALKPLLPILDPALGKGNQP